MQKTKTTRRTSRQTAALGQRRIKRSREWAATGTGLHGWCAACGEKALAQGRITEFVHCGISISGEVLAGFVGLLLGQRIDLRHQRGAHILGLMFGQSAAQIMKRQNVHKSIGLAAPCLHRTHLESQADVLGRVAADRAVALHAGHFLSRPLCGFSGHGGWAGGLGQLWPDFCPITWAKVSARYFPTSNQFDFQALLDWRPALLPVAHCRNRNIQLFCQNITSAQHSGRRVDGVFIVHFDDAYSFHAATITRIVFIGQHHVMTPFVFNT